jgi:hypothetical protein
MSWALLGLVLIVLGYIKIFTIDPDMPLEEVVRHVKIWNLAIFLGAGSIGYYLLRRRP